jgi:hypothetical protein
MPCKHVHAVHTLFDGSDKAEQSDADEDDEEAVDQPTTVAVEDRDMPNETRELRTTAHQLEAHATSIANHLQVTHATSVSIYILES